MSRTDDREALKDALRYAEATLPFGGPTEVQP